MNTPFRFRLHALSLAMVAAAFAVADQPTRFEVENIVSDLPGVAPILDPNLVNPWGVALNPAGGPFWVSNQGTGVSTLYGGGFNGTPYSKVPLVVTIPGGNPTGQVFNGSSDFKVSNGAATAPARFITAGLSGIIAGWSPAIGSTTLARVGIGVTGSTYTGLAIGNDGTRNLLYAANIAQNRIDVFDPTYSQTTVPGMFLDPNIPVGFRPFNIQAVGNSLYVCYTNPALGDIEGNGVVNQFDMNGNLLRRFATFGPLSQPWGVTKAPAEFGSFGGSILIGNFGDGRINGYRSSDGKKLGFLKTRHGGPIRLERLWALLPGNGISAGDSDDIYFTAGIQDETHGLFGEIGVDDE
jgi:uncharacterized protein (TIGR03118 family)